ncbi:MAG: ABC transporter ATP-binding protein [Thermoplasmata archaeon]|nr:ABC transporter ATP-binding protein [Thermoplasmata archaeon]
MIEVEGLSKSFGWRNPVAAVSDISFHVDNGSIFGLLGPVNAGKTTLMRILATALKPSSGTVRIGGFDTMAQTREVRELIGYMPETMDFSTWGSGPDYLRFWARVTGLSGAGEKARIAELSDFLQIPEGLKGNPETYTVGVQKRLMLAQALYSDPEVLLLDEPLTGTAGEDRGFLMSRLEDLRRLGKTTVMATPQLSEVQVLSDQVSVLLEGQATEAFPTADLLRQVGEGRHARIFVKAGDLSSDALASVKRLSGVIEVKLTSVATVIYVDPGRVNVDLVRETLEGAGAEDATVEAAEITLGDVFRAIVREGS